MANTYIINLKPVKDILELIRTKISVDVPKGNKIVEQELRDTTTLILEYLLLRKELEDKGLDIVKFTEQYDFLDQCNILLEELKKDKIFQIISSKEISNILVLSPHGDITITQL